MNYKFLLYFSYSYAIPIGVPLEEEILRRGYTVKWFTHIPEAEKDIPQNSEALHSIQGVISYEPDIILSITDMMPDFLQGLKVQVFHGFNPDKRQEGEHFIIRGLYDLYCTQGPATTKGFKSQQEKYKHFDVIETGWPKMDPLFSGDTETRNNHELPVVMITSTFSHRLSLALRDEVYEEIQRLAGTGKYNFIATLHPILPAGIIEKWKSLNGKHFTFYDTTYLIPLFKKADIMFSDTTSAIQEFTLTQKPIVTYCHKRPKPYLINVTAPGDIEAALDYALTFPPEKINEIKKIANEIHPYRDGKSAKRVIDAVIGFLHKDKSYLTKKPLNLIRKYKIRKRLDYFTFKSYSKAFTKKLRD